VRAANSTGGCHFPAQASVTPWVNITGKGLYTLLVVDPDAPKVNASAPAGEWCIPPFSRSATRVFALFLLPQLYPSSLESRRPWLATCAVPVWLQKSPRTTAFCVQ